MLKDAGTCKQYYISIILLILILICSFSYASTEKDLKTIVQQGLSETKLSGWEQQGPIQIYSSGKKAFVTLEKSKLEPYGRSTIKRSVYLKVTLTKDFGTPSKTFQSKLDNINESEYLSILKQNFGGTESVLFVEKPLSGSRILRPGYRSYGYVGGYFLEVELVLGNTSNKIVLDEANAAKIVEILSKNILNIIKPPKVINENQNLPEWVRKGQVYINEHGEGIYVPEWLDWMKPKRRIKVNGSMIEPRGEVWIYNRAFRKWVRASASRKIYSGDIIRTGPHSTCRVVFTNEEGKQDLVSIGPMTLLESPSIDEESKYPTLWSLYEGIIKVKGALLRTAPVNVEPSPFILHTVTVCTATRGSEVIISHNPTTQTTKLFVNEGIMDVATKKNREIEKLTPMEQLLVENGNMRKKKPMNRKVWEKLVANNELSVGGDDTVTPDESSFDVPRLMATVKSMKFFESPKQKIPRNQRKYNSRFSKAETRYINWELALEYPKAERETLFIIDAVWYRPDGTVYFKQTKKTKIKQGWERSFHGYGQGWIEAGKWKPGTYRVELKIDGKKIAEASFNIIQ